MLFDHRRSRKFNRRNVLKATAGAAAGLYTFGFPGTSVQRTSAQQATLAEILAIPGAGVQPTEADMEKVGELCLRSTKKDAYKGQTVTFIGLNNANAHNNIFRPLSLRRLGSAHRRGHHQLDRCSPGGNFRQGAAGRRHGRGRVRPAGRRRAVEGDLLGRGLCSAMPDWVKEQIVIDDYVNLLKAPVGTWTA